MKVGFEADEFSAVADGAEGAGAAAGVGAVGAACVEAPGGAAG